MNYPDSEVFFEAVVHGTLSQVIELIDHHKADVNTKGKEGNTALHIACLKGKEDLLIALCERGINMDEKNHFGQTAYQLALQEGRDKLAESLCDKGCNTAKAISRKKVEL